MAYLLNAGATPVRFLEVISPPAFANYFSELAALIPHWPAVGAVRAADGVSCGHALAYRSNDTHSVSSLSKPPMRIICIFAALAVLLVPLTPVSAQHRTLSPFDRGHTAAPGLPSTALRPGDTYMVRSSGGSIPRWLKWGLVGSGVGAVTFALLGGMTIDSSPNPVLQDAALGAAAGFVIVGGSIALYDALCSRDSPSRRAGLC